MDKEQIVAVGNLLRDWRRRRHLSQLELACEAEVSARHLSFIETGRSQPSREMILHLAESLNVPIRERNSLLIAAGYAPVFKERSFEDPDLDAARKVVSLVLTGHEPYPALAIDRHWNMVASNRAVAPFLTGIDAELLTPPVNVLRLSLHPQGLGPRIANAVQWRSHLLSRLKRQIDVTTDPILVQLFEELSNYPIVGGNNPESTVVDYAGVAVPFQISTDAGVLSFLSTTTVFGTPVDITLSELALESFFPADSATAEFLIQAMKRSEQVATG
ncbi:helix-turn-helix transcriptional regulator [bacterium]|nr:helix-turn-helix transcriptional regulator [bacterium]